jgi:hypothetical protein
MAAAHPEPWLLALITNNKNNNRRPTKIQSIGGTMCLKRDGTRAETRFLL